ncbi:MAG: C-terminal binding protein [Dehalococcoidales bacterium]|nr:C-terminal binding protein [Dehalococcoidales bacterium]
MAFRVVFVAYADMMVKELPENVIAAGADLSVYTVADTEEDLISLCADADCVITNQSYFPFTPRVFRELPKCKFLLTASIGYDALNVEAATELGIGIVNLRGFCSEELAEHSMSLMMACARNIVTANSRVREGKPAPRLTEKEGRHLTILKGKTLGIVGFGLAGRALVPKARGFEMEILSSDPFVEKEVFERFGVEKADLDKLLEKSDFIAIHASLNSTSFHLMGPDQFNKMKPTAFVINTARGAIIDEPALVSALSDGNIAGAGLDVTEQEPLPPDSPLTKLNNVILTGHRAGSSRESNVIWGKRPAEDIARMMRCEWPVGLVNPEVKEKFVAKWGPMKEPRDVDF